MDTSMKTYTEKIKNGKEEHPGWGGGGGEGRGISLLYKRT